MQTEPVGSATLNQWAPVVSRARGRVPGQVQAGAPGIPLPSVQTASPLRWSLWVRVLISL